MQKKIVLCACSALVMVVICASIVSGVLSADSITVKLQPINMSSGSDVIDITYNGTSQVITAFTRSDPEIVFENFQEYGNASRGYIRVTISNVTIKTYDFSVAMMSSESFSVAISIMSGEGSESTFQHAMVLPANITTQIDMEVLFGAAQIAPVDFGWRASPSFPPWALMVYAVSISTFILTAFLDKRDLQVIRKRWKFTQTFAIMLRYIFYAAIVIFFLITAGLVAEVIYQRIFNLPYSYGLGDWIVAALFAVILLIMYGIGKWRDLYDVLDEE